MDFGAPKFQVGLQDYGLIQIRLDMQDWMICLHPNLDDIAAAFDLNRAIFQLQNLREISGINKRIGVELDPYSPQFDQFAQLSPSVGFRHQEHQIAILLRPDIRGQIAIANRHGVVFVFP